VDLQCRDLPGFDRISKDLQGFARICKDLHAFAKICSISLLSGLCIFLYADFFGLALGSPVP